TGDSSVVAVLFGALQEISALTGRAAADGPEPALAAVRQEVDARLDVLHATAKQQEARLSTTVYMAKLEAQQIGEQAKAQAEATQANAEAEAKAILDKARSEAEEMEEIVRRDEADTPPDGTVEAPDIDHKEARMESIYAILVERSDKPSSARYLAR